MNKNKRWIFILEIKSKNKTRDVKINKNNSFSDRDGHGTVEGTETTVNGHTRDNWIKRGNAHVLLNTRSLTLLCYKL